MKKATKQKQTTLNFGKAKRVKIFELIISPEKRR
jgi:hypothetical protein